MKTFLLQLLIVSIAQNSFCQNATQGVEFMKKRQDALSINTLQSDITIKNITKNGKSQERVLKQYIKRTNEGEDYYHFLLTYTAPADVKGTSVLTWEHPHKEDDQWLYLPSLRKSRRISASGKTDRFVGTEVTYEDLSNYLSETLEDYSYTFVRKEVKNGYPCMVLEAVPKNPSLVQESAYSKRVLWISEKENIDIFTEYYDKKGDLLKTVTASNIISIKNKFRALEVVVKNIQTGNSTEIKYSNIKIDESLNENYFTKEYLESL